MTVEGTSERWDVVVLGAGAAGLCAAIHAAERGRSVLLLEKNRKAGVKILMSGGTRCNLTNARGLHDLVPVSGPIDPGWDPRLCRGPRAIAEAFVGEAGRFLGPSLRALDVAATVRLFEAEGVATKVEATGKIFPVSNRATDVLDALLRRLDRSGACLRLGVPARSIEKTDDGFLVGTNEATVVANAVIVAVGGQSYPGSGTTGDGYAFARRFGHTVHEPRPALVPLRVEADWVPPLRGVTLPDVVASVIGPDGRVREERREALLFAHFGLTGPAVLDVSRAVARWDGPGTLSLSLNLLPETRENVLEARLLELARRGRPPVAHLLPESLPRRLVAALLQVAEIPEGRVGPELSKSERRRLLETVTALRLPIVGTLGFAKAEVTSGGVALDEVEAKTMESRRCSGLFFCGEVLDLDGRIGGYNFQAAWSTGWLAGGAV